MTQSIWSKLFTALRGGASEVGEAIVDQQALRILDQEIRDADTALANAKRELVTIMAKHKLSADRVAEYNAKIQDLETKAMAAIQANREDLALEVAEAISTLTNELEVEQSRPPNSAVTRTTCAKTSPRPKTASRACASKWTWPRLAKAYRKLRSALRSPVAAPTASWKPPSAR